MTNSDFVHSAQADDRPENLASDRELLELAAKAVGFDHISVHADGETYAHDGICNPLQWNPLNDDGDAMRLAVKLRMDVEMSLIHCGFICADVWDDSIEEYRSVKEPEGADHAAATRRAIVRVAAELAKATGEQQ